MVLNRGVSLLPRALDTGMLLYDIGFISSGRRRSKVSRPGSRILQRQNDPSALTVLRAISASHKRAQHLASGGTTVSIVVAATGFIGIFTKFGVTSVTIVGALWALLYSTGLTSWANKERERAAKLQEMFDVELFSLGWNPLLAGEQIGAHEVNRLSQQYRGRLDMVLDYYEIPDLPRPFDVLACQQQNLGWGARVHRRYAFTVLACVCAWSAAGLVLGSLASLTVTEVLLRWYIPSLGALMLGLSIFRQQNDVTRERQRVLGLLTSRIDAVVANSVTPAVAADLLQLARQIQDAIFLARHSASRVPDWFFLRYRANDRADFRAAMDELERRVGGSRRSTTP